MPGVPNRRPQLELVTPAASPEEAAAVIAAVERFLRDHAPVAAPAEDAVSGWVRTARHEAVSREPEPGLWS